MNENDTRAESLPAFGVLSDIVPEMRAGQVLAAAGELWADLHGGDLWEASDAELIAAVWRFRRQFEAATARTNPQEA